MKTQTIFDERVWVSFPPYLSVSNILQLIHQQLEQHQLEQLDHQQLDSKNTSYSGNDVEKKVQAKLLHKKFLLVLDGDLSNSDWMTLQYALQKNDKGSRVVRIIQGSHVRPPWISESDWIPVEKFLPEETTKFFEKWVSNEGKQETIEVGNGKLEGKTEEDTPPMDVRLHSMTGGLPLAVVLLCGLLKTKEYPHEWDKVLDHLKSKQSRLLDNILTMCFDDLPHDLKSCFLYFAVLPMNTVIEFNRLVCMWRAEGFLRPKDGKTMEKLGKIYLKELVARNLVKVVKRESFSGGPFVAVHHKVHSFLLLEAQEANFVEIHNGDDRPPSANTRRLSLQNYKDKYAALANSPLRKLRSILSTFQEEKGQGTDDKKQRGAIPQNDMTSPHKHIENMLKESKFLRVINLKGIEIGEELPATISTAAQLQYLCVTACSLERIPPEIGKLKHLETLDVRHTNVRRLPTSFWKIKMLRHVFGSHLILPRRVGNLKYLQTLQTVHPDKSDGWDQDTFKTMVNLQSLYLSDYSGDEANVNAICDVIGNPELLEYLEKLTLKVSKRTNIKGDVFTSHSQTRIRAMALHGKLVFAEPKAEFHVPNLTFLSLKRTKVSEDFIYGLGELPLLVDLILEQGSYKGRQLDFVGGHKFRSLKRLTLSSLKKLEKLVIDKEALVELTHLVIMSYNEDFKVDVDTGREFVKRIEIEDKQLYYIIVRESLAKKQSDQLSASSNT
ncbi:hypothetical protein HU200_034603 [Digitaria exilis]|uniref:NB-ARC domain-containing protein n=1 Tax=Digitaria exilis TaxID=1010633 RepID=A0A835BVF2_9POAL|nr:hypothetical protein HU200_034603 [Digitaria exilis]